MRYSYATISLPTLTPERAVDALAAAGFTGVEWKVGEAPHRMTTNASRFLVDNLCTVEETDAAAADAARLAAAADLTVVGLAPYVRSGDLDHLRRVLGMAVSAGTHQVRLQAPRPVAGGPGYRELFAGFLAFLRDGVPEATAAGVRLVMEIHHGTIVPSVGLAHPLLGSFDPAEFGVIYDVGNLVFEGYEDHRMALQILGPYLHHVHVKNARPVRGHSGRWRFEWSALDDGLVDVGHVLSLLDEQGYDGWVSLEDLSTVRDPLTTMQYNAAVLAGLDAPGWRRRRPATGGRTALTISPPTAP